MYVLVILQNIILLHYKDTKKSKTKYYIPKMNTHEQGLFLLLKKIGFNVSLLTANKYTQSILRNNEKFHGFSAKRIISSYNSSNPTKIKHTQYSLSLESILRYHIFL